MALTLRINFQTGYMGFYLFCFIILFHASAMDFPKLVLPRVTIHRIFFLFWGKIGRHLHLKEKYSFTCFIRYELIILRF